MEERNKNKKIHPVVIVQLAITIIFWIFAGLTLYWGITPGMGFGALPFAVFFVAAMLLLLVFNCIMTAIAYSLIILRKKGKGLILSFLSLASTFIPMFGFIFF